MYNITIGFTWTYIYRRQQEKKKRWLGSIKQLINMVQGPCRWAQTAADVFAGYVKYHYSSVSIVVLQYVRISFKEMYFIYYQFHTVIGWMGPRIIHCEEVVRPVFPTQNKTQHLFSINLYTFVNVVFILYAANPFFF